MLGISGNRVHHHFVYVFLLVALQTLPINNDEISNIWHLNFWLEKLNVAAQGGLGPGLEP